MFILRSLGLVSILGALSIILFVVQWNQEGFFQSIEFGSVLISIGFSILRVGFLIACGWATWFAPREAAWLSFGAFLAFAIGGAAEAAYSTGFVAGLSNLIPAYYIMATVPLVVTIIIWLLVIDRP